MPGFFITMDRVEGIMSRIIALIAGLLVAGVVHAAAPINILLLMSDDHNHQALSCAGSQVRTPNLDRLAAEGVRFTHCFVPNPICTPARAAIFTGQDNFTNGCYFFGMPIAPAPGSSTFATTLRDAGYETWFTGKWHNDGEPWTRGYTSGGPVWRGGTFDHTALPVVGWSGKQRTPANKYSSELFADAAIDFLRSRDDGARPFCMVMSFTVPHDPWLAPPPYDQMYDARMMEIPANFMAKPPFKFDPASFPALRDQQQIPWPRPAWAIRAALSQYYGMITHMDGQIGRVLDELERQGVAQDTLVIFVGDHGYSMGSHGFVGKQTMYEEGIRTPLLMRLPRLPRKDRDSAVICDELVSLMDLAPTICDAAGVKLLTAQGQSLLGLYRGEGDWPRDRIFAAFESQERHGMATRAVRTRTHKFIQHLLTGETELYDLQHDPLEMKNLIESAEHAAMRRELEASLNDWRRASGDPRTAATSTPGKPGG